MPSDRTEPRQLESMVAPDHWPIGASLTPVRVVPPVRAVGGVVEGDQRRSIRSRARVPVFCPRISALGTGLRCRSPRGHHHFRPSPSPSSSSRRFLCSQWATAIGLSSCLRRQHSRTGRRSGYPSSCRGRSLRLRSCCRRGRLRRRSHWSTSPRRPLPWWPQQGFNNPRN